MLRDEKDIIGYAQVTEIYNADLTEMCGFAGLHFAARPNASDVFEVGPWE